MTTKKLLLSLVGAALVITAVGATAYYVYRHRTIVSLQTQHEQALTYEMRAKRMYQAGNFIEAKNCFEKAVDNDPHLYTSYCGLGIIAEEHDHNPAAALGYYKKALAINPRHVPTYLRISDLLYRQGLPDKALAVEKYACAIDERQALFSMGQNHYWNGKLAEAHSCYERALALTQPNNVVGRATILSKIGTLYEKENKTQEAFNAYQQAVLLCPHREELHTALSCAYLAMGDVKKCAEEYEWRLLGSNWQTNVWQHKEPVKRWDRKTSLANKKVALICENGYGDMIQFIRFAPELKKRGAHVCALVQKPLIPLFSQLGYLDEIFPGGSALPAHDYVIPIQSLPFYFPNAAKNLPKPPYLTIDKSLQQSWHKILATDTNFKVGLCWQTPHDHVAIPQSRRALDASLLTPLFSVPGVSFYSLQLDPMNATLQTLGLKSFGANFDKEHGPFMDSAAVAYALDLVITVDTSLAHLVGALNRPVWVMLPVAADVRWGINKATTPWYPSMRLFRQKMVGDWRPVVEEVRKELAKKIRA